MPSGCCRSHFGGKAAGRLEPRLGFAGQGVTTGLPVQVPDAAESDVHYKGIDQRSGYLTRALIAAPMTVVSPLTDIGTSKPIPPCRAVGKQR